MIMKNNTLSTTCVFDTAFSFLFYSTQIAYLSTSALYVTSASRLEPSGTVWLRPLPVWNRLEPSGYVRFPSGTVWLRPLVVNLISRQQKPLLADFYFLRPAVMPCLDYCFFGIGI
jgi:hypothetical protein